MVRIGASVLVVLLVVTGCSKKPAPAPAASPDTPARSSTPTTRSAVPVLTFTANGIGQYRLGAKLSELQAAGALTEVKSGPETCMETFAQGAGALKDLAMIFGTDGILRMVSNSSAATAASSGARIGDTMATLQKIYGPAGEKVTGDNNSVAYLVTETSGRGIMFYLDDKGKVTTMAAGDAEVLKSGFLDHIDC